MKNVKLLEICIAAFLSAASCAVIYGNGQALALQGYRCHTAFACNVDPCQWLRINDPCRQCNGGASHSQCTVQAGAACSQLRNVAGGCGFEINGLCTAIGCGGPVTQTACDQFKCQ